MTDQRPPLTIGHPGTDVFIAVTINPGSELGEEHGDRTTCYVYPGEPEYEPVLELMRARVAREEPDDDATAP